MAAFFKKNLSAFALPQPSTLSSTALNDVHLATVSKIKDLLSDVKSLCLLLYGWMDRYHARPYMGLRVFFVKDWQFLIVTKSCRVLHSHTSEHVADYVL